MTKTIAELYNGNLVPIKNLGRFNNEIKQLETLMEKNLETLEKELSEEQKVYFSRYAGNINEYMLLSCEQAFCDGFCMGAKITAEALYGAEKII